MKQSLLQIKWTEFPLSACTENEKDRETTLKEECETH
jgi:hypothetical protein